MLSMARRRDVMGPFVLPPLLAGMGWLATAVMAVTALAMLVTAAM
jgi:Mn2+/Fe2+ NRAMP family transporter